MTLGRGLLLDGDWMDGFGFKEGKNGDVPSVEDSNVQLLRQLLDLSGSFPHALQGRVVHEHQGDFAFGGSVAFDLVDDGFPFVHVAHGADYVGSGGVHGSQGLDADS